MAADPTDENRIRAIASSLVRERTVDIVTRGRRSGRTRTTEIWTSVVDGEVYLCGTLGAVGGRTEPPRTRDWLHNLRSHPTLVLRLKTSVVAELSMTGVEITDSDQRRAIYSAPATEWYRDNARSVDELVEHAPCVRLDPADDTARAVIDRLPR